MYSQTKRLPLCSRWRAAFCVAVTVLVLSMFATVICSEGWHKLMLVCNQCHGFGLTIFGQCVERCEVDG